MLLLHTPLLLLESHLCSMPPFVQLLPIVLASLPLPLSRSSRSPLCPLPAPGSAARSADPSPSTVVCRPAGVPGSCPPKYRRTEVVVITGAAAAPGPGRALSLAAASPGHRALHARTHAHCAVGRGARLVRGRRRRVCSRRRAGPNAERGR